MSLLSAIGPRIIGLLFLIAAVSKLTHPATSENALIAIGLSPLWAVNVIFVVTVLEVYLSFLLLFEKDLRFSLVASMSLMTVFVIFTFYLSTMANPPSCGCLGLARIFESSRYEAFGSLVRNCLILWLLKICLDRRFPPSLIANNQSFA